MRTHRLAVAACAAAATVPLAIPASTLARPDRVDDGIVRAVNQVRMAHGLRALRADGPLAAVAASHSRSMARHHTLTHGAFARRVQPRAHTATIGETISWLSPRTRGSIARRVVADWLRSPGHRAVLLSPRFHRIGVGRDTGRGGTYVTADLAR